MADVLSLARRNGAITRYGPRSPSPPSSYLAYGRGAIGRGMRNARRLASLPPIQIDDKALEVSQAVVFGSTIVTCVMINVLGGPLHLEDITPLTNLDNFFDDIASSMSLLVRMNEDKLPDALRSGDIARRPPIAFFAGASSSLLLLLILAHATSTFGDESVGDRDVVCHDDENNDVVRHNDGSGERKERDGSNLLLQALLSLLCVTPRV